MLRVFLFGWLFLASSLGLSQETEPLTLAEQGSFFIGGEKLALGPDSDITVNQLYVQYQIPVGDAGVSVVMTHGCCLSSKTWETTPDGRMGWDEYLVRQGHAVYLTDQVGRARSGFNGVPFNEAKNFERFPDEQPLIGLTSYQQAWEIFRFGPYRQPHDGLRFPIGAVEELYKQMIPDLNEGLPEPNPTWEHLAELGENLGGAVLVGHSQSGVFPQHAAVLRPGAVKGIVSLEPAYCSQNYGQSEEGTPSDEAIIVLTGIPMVFVYGDYVENTFWQRSLEDCRKFVDTINAAGGKAAVWHLPELGIEGNSHMLMQDDNSLELADMLLEWIEQNVE